MYRIAIAVLLLAPSISLSQGTATPTTLSSTAPTSRATAAWNLAGTSHLALSGYDPVAYFPEGGGKPAKGAQSISLVHGGVLYRFATEANKAAFESNPARYEPAYGGWCAWAMKQGDKVEVDPESFVIQDNRLLLFYNGVFADTRSKWLKGDATAEAAAADASWLKISGEAPRPTSLQARLDAKNAEFRAKASPQTTALFEQGIQDIAASGVLATALKVGDTAPDFELPDARGGNISLKSMLASGPVVVTWYRGGWCPYCNLQLIAYQDMLPELDAAGAKLVAISPQAPDSSLSTAEKDQLRFAVCSDPGNRVAHAYGIAYKLAEPVRSYLEKGVSLSKVNADDSGELPLAATYVIDRSGKIIYAFVEADYRKRAEPADILQAVRSAK